MAASAILLDKVSKVYQIGMQRIEALRGVDLEVGSGRQVAVTGKSGSGKSTLLHVIGTLDRPTSGKVWLKGVDISHLDDERVSQFRNGTVGFVFQMNNLLPEFTAVENVMMPGLIAGAPKELIRGRAMQLLSAVQLEQRALHRPSELSGGEQQRVAIARALIMNPEILLADEPTGNLDKSTSFAVQDLLLLLCQQHQITMLLVTHDLELASRLPHRVVMEDGQIISGGSVL